MSFESDENVPGLTSASASFPKKYTASYCMLLLVFQTHQTYDTTVRFSPMSEIVLNEIARCIPSSGELSHISKRECCQHVVDCTLAMDSPHVCCSLLALSSMVRSWLALCPLRVHCVSTHCSQSVCRLNG